MPMQVVKKIIEKDDKEKHHFCLYYGHNFTLLDVIFPHGYRCTNVTFANTVKSHLAYTSIVSTLLNVPTIQSIPVM